MYRALSWDSYDNALYICNYYISKHVHVLMFLLIRKDMAVNEYEKLYQLLHIY